MSRCTALVLLAAVVLTTSAVAIRYRDGHDFIYNVWAQTHALLTGSNLYGPGNVEYFQRYSVPVVALALDLSTTHRAFPSSTR